MSRAMRGIEFTVSDHDWLATMWPEHADDFKKPGFECAYTLREDERGCQYYELLTSDGRTSWNDLNGYEKMCLRDCQEYFDNRLQLVGCPDYCMAMTASDGMTFSYRL